MLPVQNLTWLELIYLNHCSKYVYTQRYGSLHSSRVFVLELTDVVAKTKKPWHRSTELCLRVCFVSNCKCHVHFSLLIIYLWLRYRESFILLKDRHYMKLIRNVFCGIWEYFFPLFRNKHFRSFEEDPLCKS